MSQHTTTKATRLLVDGKVHPCDTSSVRTFQIEGDTDLYKTVVGPNLAMCSCKRWRETMQACSHIEAAIMFVNASPDERAMMQALLDAKSGEAA